ncbi:MAG: DUF4105 domain-containing protein [Candidatus Eremiobacteraeota bacterium]|nr:DUF4105 domain-containing protein [Candidatus Eremiobacteraeota bacterium]MCW5871167.1 DUF4105 domain-containing protein [Candidatus Eremiobacteraeota bacterium]
MRISNIQPSPVRSLQNKEPRTAEQNKQAPADQVEIKGWDPTTRYAGLAKRHLDGRVEIDGVRWGLEEVSQSKKEWTPRFSRTTIDTNAVKDVYLARAPFMAGIPMAHALLIVEFDEKRPMRNANGDEDNRLVLSVEAKMHEGERWDAMRGFKGDFPVVFQLGSFTDGVQRACRRLGTGIQMYKLKLDDQQKKMLLENSLDVSLARPDAPYHTTRNSCYSNVIDLVNSVVPRQQQIPKRSEWFAYLLQKPTSANAMLCGAALQDKGLLAEGNSQFIHNDLTLYPGSQTEATPRQKKLAAMSQHALWRPACRVGGAALGGGLGYAIGTLLPGAGAAVGGIAGGLLGARLGRIAADEVRASCNVDYLSPQPWYRPYLAGGSPGIQAADDKSSLGPRAEN